MSVYTIGQYIVDIVDTESEDLFNYHNKIIWEYIEKCSNIFNKESKGQLIDSFITQKRKY